MPLVSKTFDQLLDFTRTSAATFVNSEGDIQTTAASRNLLTWTQQFDNAAWTKSNATVTANTTVAPDGTSTADKLIDNATNGGHNSSQSCPLTSGVSYTLSAYVKKDDLSFCAIGVYDAATKYQTFDLNTGAKGSSSGVTGSTIDPVGNGWYRVSITFVAAITGTCFPTVYLINSTAFAGYVGSGTGIFIWGAQLEAASAATTYTRNNGGVFPPRFDYDPVTLAPKGLLVEEQRTNLATYSEQFDNVAWTKFNATVTANATLSPDGTTNADKLIATNGGSNANCSQTPTLAASTAYTETVFAKKGEWDWVALETRGEVGDVLLAWFNLATGVVGTVNVGATATITNFGNGWYRCSLTRTTGATTTSPRARVYSTNADAVISTGDGTSGIFIYGAQLEAGSFATSYIPTVASQVTRTADQTSIVAPNFAPWYNQSEGTFVAQFDVLSVASTSQQNIVALRTSGTNDMRIWLWEGAPTLVRWGATNGTGQADITSSAVTANTVIKAAAAYKLNDFAASYNGAATVTDTSATVPTGFSELSIGAYTGPTGPMCGHIRSIRYYPTRLTNAQLQALTA